MKWSRSGHIVDFLVQGWKNLGLKNQVTGDRLERSRFVCHVCHPELCWPLTLFMFGFTMLVAGVLLFWSMVRHPQQRPIWRPIQLRVALLSNCVLKIWVFFFLLSFSVCFLTLAIVYVRTSAGVDGERMVGATKANIWVIFKEPIGMLSGRWYADRGWGFFRGKQYPSFRQPGPSQTPPARRLYPVLPPLSAYPSPPPPVFWVIQKMAGYSVLPEEQEAHHYSFMRFKVPGCWTFVRLRAQMWVLLEKKKKDKRWGWGGGIGYLLLRKQKGIKCPVL